MAVLCAFSLGLWQMLDADGWCLLMVLYMVLSDTLADRSMARRQQVRLKGCFTFTYFWLATSWFVSGGCACYLSFRFLSLVGSGNLKQEGVKGAERLHPYKQTNKECHWRWKQPVNTCLQADENNLPHMLASKSSQTQDSRQQRATTRKRRIRSKNTDESCSKNRWMEIDIEQRRASEEANQNKTDAETFLQQTQDQSQRKLILSYVFFQILLGPVGDALARAMPYEMLVPRCEGICSVWIAIL